MNYVLDKNTKSKVDRGLYNIDAKIDLHGLSLDEAYREFSKFIKDSYNQKLRLILIITGYGKKGQSVIRNSFENWISNFSDIVIYCTQSVQKHGGQGSFYVLLKRNMTSKFDKL